VTDVLAGGLMRLVRTWAPDRILSTYWAPAALKRWIPRSAGRRVPLSTVITDADLHVAWFQPDVDVYYVSDDSIRDRLVPRRLPPRPRRRFRHSRPSSIPTALAAGDAREALGLRPDRRWILLVAGPRSMRPLALRARDLIDATPGIGFLVLAGRDESLLRRLAERPHPDLVVAGMVPDLERWIAASDLVVAKGGGLITAETTAVGRPLLIHRPIPGQEEANAVRLERAGAARVIRDADHLRRLVGRLFGSEGDGVVERMARASGRLGRPEAARTIAQEEARRLDGLPS
jgi:processive 1,2-diacylglycerol beta-glucosyltransferase